MGGLNSIHPNDVAIQADLDSNWEVLGEPIQTAMRACELAGLPGMDKPYEKVKELMRGHTINKEQVATLILRMIRLGAAVFSHSRPKAYHRRR